MTGSYGFDYDNTMAILALALIYPILTTLCVFLIIRNNERNQDKVMQAIMSLTGNTENFIKIDAYNRSQVRQNKIESEKKKEKKKPVAPEGLIIL